MRATLRCDPRRLAANLSLFWWWVNVYHKISLDWMQRWNKTCCMWQRELGSARCHNRIARPNGAGHLTTRGHDAATCRSSVGCRIASVLLAWLFPMLYQVYYIAQIHN